MDATPGDIPFDALLKHRAWVRALAARLVRDPNLADDLEQQTWMAALRRPPVRTLALRGWLGKVARNQALEHQRSEARRRARQEAASRAEAEQATDDVVATAELQQQVVQAVLELDDAHRKVILLRFFEGLKPAAVASRLGIPVETARTRQKRALAALRRRFEDERGGHEPFMQWLAPLTLSAAGTASVASTVASSAPAKGGGVVLSAKLVAGALILVTGIVGTINLLDEGSVGPPEPASRNGVGNTAGTTRTDPPVDPVRTQPFVAPDSGTEDATDTVQPSRKARDAEPRVWGSGLALRLRVKPDVLRVGEPAIIESIFWNKDEQPLKFYIPEHAGMIAFPRIRLTDSRGRVFACETPAFQSMWRQGMQGMVIELAAGQQHVVRNTVRGFVPVDSKTDKPLFWTQHASLPAGNYRLEATYRHARASVPVSTDIFKVEERPVPGLWTGTLRAIPSGLLIQETGEPVFAIETRKPARPEAGLTLALTVRNPGLEDFAARGRLSCNVHLKAGPSATATLRLDATASENHLLSRLDIQAGGSRTWIFDLDDPLFEGSRLHATRTPARTGLLRDLIPEGLAAVTVAFQEEGEGQDKKKHSNLIFARIPALPDLASKGLVLEARIPEGPLSTAPVIDLELRNDGSETFRVPRVLGLERELRVELYKLGKAKLPTLFPDRVRNEETVTSREVIEMDRRPEHGSPKKPGEYRSLPPGASIGRSLDLRRRLAGPLTPGRYELRLAWRNTEDGRHMPHGAGSLTVGTTKAATVNFTVMEQ
jgi:RNA polymerase sigma-70 factor (ECF subfamily)